MTTVTAAVSSLDVLILISVCFIKGWGLYFWADSCSCSALSPKQTNHLGCVTTCREQRNVTTQPGHHKVFPGKICSVSACRGHTIASRVRASHCSPDIWKKGYYWNANSESLLARLGMALLSSLYCSLKMCNCLLFLKQNFRRYLCRCTISLHGANFEIFLTQPPSQPL